MEKIKIFTEKIKIVTEKIIMIKKIIKKFIKKLPKSLGLTRARVFLKTRQTRHVDGQSSKCRLNPEK